MWINATVGEHAQRKQDPMPGRAAVDVSNMREIAHKYVNGPDPHAGSVRKDI